MVEEVIRASGEEIPTVDSESSNEVDAWSLLNSSTYHCTHSHLLRSLEVEDLLPKISTLQTPRGPRKGKEGVVSSVVREKTRKAAMDEKSENKGKGTYTHNAVVQAFHALHLVYEGFRLNQLKFDSLLLLGNLLCEVATRLGWTAYSDYYQRSGCERYLFYVRQFFALAKFGYTARSAVFASTACLRP
jgi:hypothetical protein